MNDDWRLRIELGEEAARGLLGRLGVVRNDADELAKELEHERLAVSHDEDTVFVYAGNAEQLDRAAPLIERELASLGLTAVETAKEHWLADEDRWDDEPDEGTVEEQTVAEGYAAWEVRIPCESHRAAQALGDQLETEGYGVVRRWKYVIAGTATREEADELAQRLHGEVEPGGELVWESIPTNPFAVFGGLGSDGTPF